MSTKIKIFTLWILVMFNLVFADILSIMVELVKIVIIWHSLKWSVTENI